LPHRVTDDVAHYAICHPRHDSHDDRHAGRSLNFSAASMSITIAIAKPIARLPAIRSEEQAALS
jgi:hypothetical protein